MESREHPFAVLITDDDANNRATMTAFLQKLLPKALIDEAEEGEMALRKVMEHIQQQHRQYDLIIMDYQMPYRNGEEATQFIREFETLHPLLEKSIIVTWSSAKVAPYPLADDWMPKPAQKSDVERILATWFDWEA